MPKDTDLPTTALSIRQPWAWAIMAAGKDIENRSWFTKFRGPVCIHAAKGMTRDEYDDAAWFMHEMGVVAPLSIEVCKGGIVGVARIVDCVNQSDSPWFFGPWGFVLTDVRPVPFIPASGALGFFGWSRAPEKHPDANTQLSMF